VDFFTEHFSTEILRSIVSGIILQILLETNGLMRTDTRTRIRRLAFNALTPLFLAFCMAISSCASTSPYKQAAQTQDSTVIPKDAEKYFEQQPQKERPPAERVQSSATPDAPRDEPLNYSNLTLIELMNVGLENSPATRSTWAAARAQAARYGRSLSDYYPYVDGEVSGAYGNIPQLQGGRSYTNLGGTLSYLLLDFGRTHRVSAAREALAAANWQHNQAIQDLLRDIPKAYYDYMGGTALIEASRKSLKEANTTVAATESRKSAGVSTIADVLQARSKAAQAKLSFVQSEGNAKIYKGALATAVGWQANTDFEISKNTASIPLGQMSSGIETLIANAKFRRPDIASARALVLQKQAELYEAKALSFPKLTGTGNANYEKMKGLGTSAYYGGFQLEIPIFHGFDFRNAAKAAAADLEMAKAKYDSELNAVVEDVWNSYNSFKTAAESLNTSISLMASASESFKVSFARYKAGAADIVELLNAQSTLADARAQEINSRMDVLRSYADLIHAVGTDLSKNTVVMDANPSLKGTPDEQ